MGRLEVRVTGQLHDLILTETLGKPIADRRPSQVVELAGVDCRPGEDQAEVAAEVVDDLEPGIRIGPLALGPKLGLDEAVPGGRDKDVWATVGLAALVVGQHLGQFRRQRQRAAVGVLDPPQPRLDNVFLRRNLDGLLGEVHVAPNRVEKLRPSLCRAQGRQNQQVPSDGSLRLGRKNEILGGSDDAFTFRLGVDVNLVLRTPGHLHVLEGVAIQLAAFDGGLEDGLDLTHLLGDRGRGVASVEALLPIDLGVVNGDRLKVLVAHYADEIVHRSVVLPAGALTDLIARSGEAVGRKVAEPHGLRLHKSHAQFAFLLGSFEFSLAPIRVPQGDPVPETILINVVEHKNELSAVA